MPLRIDKLSPDGHLKLEARWTGGDWFGKNVPRQDTQLRRVQSLNVIMSHSTVARNGTDMAQCQSFFWLFNVALNWLMSIIK